MKAFGEFLKPEQITRLKQISYHQRGAMAFADPEVAKKLNLTDAQKSEIQTIVQESQTQMREISSAVPGRPRGRDEEDGRDPQGDLEKAAAKLNDEQQKTWKELIGAPFEVQFQRRGQ